MKYEKPTIEIVDLELEAVIAAASPSGKSYIPQPGWDD